MNTHRAMQPIVQQLAKTTSTITSMGGLKNTADQKTT